MSKKYFAALAATVLFYGAVKADNSTKVIPPVFVPFSVNYVGGVLANITALKDEDTGKFYVFTDLRDCREKLQGATEKALMSAPEGAGVVGMCIPVASLDPTTRKTL